MEGALCAGHPFHEEMQELTVVVGGESCQPRRGWLQPNLKFAGKLQPSRSREYVVEGATCSDRELELRAGARAINGAELCSPCWISSERLRSGPEGGADPSARGAGGDE